MTLIAYSHIHFHSIKKLLPLIHHPLTAASITEQQPAIITMMPSIQNGECR